MVRSAALLFIVLAASVGACPNVRNCRECTIPKEKETKICKTCNYAFFDEATLSCKTEVGTPEENCNQYVRDGDKVKCVSCDFGHRLSARNKCVKCPTEHCAVCDADLKCTACFWGIRVKDGFCEAKNQCELANCQVCLFLANKQPTCELCGAGYALNEHGECVLSSDNCMIADKDENKLCSKCRSGFYLDDHYLCKPNDNKPAGGSSAWFWIFFLLLAMGVGAAFFYRSKKRQGPLYQKVNAEDYVTVN